MVKRVPVMLIYGDDVVRIEGETQRVRKGFHPADIITLEGAQLTLGELADACLTAGLFEPERLVIVHDLQLRLKGLKKEAPQVEEMVRIMGSMAPTTSLLLLSPGMSGDDPLLYAVRSIAGSVQNFALPRKQELPRWIQQRAKSLGTEIEWPAAETLADLIGPDAIGLNTELEKLATYAAPGQAISAQMVDELVGQVTQESIFALVDAIADGKRHTAFNLLQQQIDAASRDPIEVAVYVIRMLARQLRILLRVQLAKVAGRSNAQIMNELKLPSYYADRYFRQANRFSVERLRRAFDQLAQLEYELKSGKAEAATGLDLLVEELSA